MKKNEYGLFTTISMIIGIVIGSGIFFKSDSILVATGGSISLGVLVFCLASIAIIFGSLSIAELASRTTKAGGVITYTEASSKTVACGLGWFHTFFYYPILIAILGWVAGMYISQLFNLNVGMIGHISIGLIIATILYLVNIFAVNIGALFQTSSTVVKIIPLIFFAIVGIIWGDPSTVEITDVTRMESTAWIAAIVPIAFSFDGWIMATSISHEVKDAKRTLPIALVFAPLFILAIYVLYFVGISTYLGPDNLIALGGEHLNVAANSLLGPWGAKIILTFITISVIGTLNGVIIGIIRLPYSLALRNMLPASEKLSKLDENSGIPINSAILTYILAIFWAIIHFVTQEYNMMPNSDISEISVAINYIVYIYLYFQVIKLYKAKEITSFWRGIFCPIMASLGSLMILAGSFVDPMFIYYALICLLVFVVAGIFWNKQAKN